MNWSIRRCSYSFLLTRSVSPVLFSWCGKLRGAHRRSAPVSICEANSNQPEDQQDKWQDGWHNQQAGLAYGCGEDLLLAKEEGTGGDEPSKAPAPEMARDTFGACNTAAHEHAQVPCGGKQHHRTHEEVHASGSAIFRRTAAHLCCAMEDT